MVIISIYNVVDISRGFIIQYFEKVDEFTTLFLRPLIFKCATLMLVKLENCFCLHVCELSNLRLDFEAFFGD